MDVAQGRSLQQVFFQFFQLASGQSVTVFKQILQNLGYNPVEAMENTINSERYDCITVE